MRKTALTLAVSSALLGAALPVAAADLSGNVGFTTDYYFRGQTQTWHKPAVQGGVDLTNIGPGFYVGTWASNISGNQFAGGSAEWDIYGGYNGKINDDLSWTVGLLGYYYPGADWNKTQPAPVANEDYDTVEWNAGLTWKWLSLKYSRTLTDFFGANTKTGYTSGSKGSNYLDLSANIPLPQDFSLGLHYGRQDVKTSIVGVPNLDWHDYKFSLTKAFKDNWSVSAAYVKGSNSAVYGNVASVGANTGNEDIRKGKLLLSVSKTF